MAKTDHANQPTDDDFDGHDAPSARSRFARIAEWAAVVVILIGAACLRIRGLDWGLPDANHLFSYHPDETVMLFHSCGAFGGINLFSDSGTSSFLPHFYNYGSLHLYLVSIATSFAAAYGKIGPIYSDVGDPIAAHIANLFYVARWLSVAMGVATVWVVWATAKLLWGRAAAICAGLVLAVMPLHVQHSHFLTVDVPAAFWISLSLYWSMRALKDPLMPAGSGATADEPPDDGSIKSSKASAGAGMDDYDPLIPKRRIINPWILAGLFAGFAAATKYNAALVILPLLVAGHFRRSESFSLALKGTAAGLAAFVVAFLVGCPGSLLETSQFLADVRYEGNHVYNHGEPAFQHTGPGWLYIISHNLTAGMGWYLLVLAGFGFAFSILRGPLGGKRKPEEWVLLAFAVPYYLLVGAAQSRYARYEIPLLPVLALWIGELSHLGFAMSGSKIKRLAPTCVVLLAIALTLPITLNLIAPMTRIDPRYMTLLILPKDRYATTYGFATMPWFYSTQVNRFFTLPRPGAWLRYESQWDYTHLVFDPNKPFDANLLREAKPDVVVMSEYEYAAPLRLGDPDARAYVEELRRDYKPPIVAQPPTKGVAVTYYDGLPVQSLPHDMLYTNPQTLLFTRKSVADAPVVGAP